MAHLPVPVARLAGRASELPADVRRQLTAFTGNVAAARSRLAEIAADLPAGARDEIAASAKRLALAARSPSSLLQALDAELERLLDVLVPMAARAPLPVSSPARARALVATAAGAAAAVSESEGFLLAASAGAAAPGAAAVAAAWLTAWAVEVWVAVSVRIHQVRAAGRDVDEARLRAEVVRALAGGRAASLATRRTGQRVAQKVAARLTRRWAAGLAPGVGIAYDAFDAQRTIPRLTAVPVDGHRPAGQVRADQTGKDQTGVEVGE